MAPTPAPVYQKLDEELLDELRLSSPRTSLVKWKSISVPLAPVTASRSQMGVPRLAVHDRLWQELAQWPSEHADSVRLGRGQSWHKKTPIGNDCHLLASKRARRFELPTSSLGSRHSRF